MVAALVGSFATLASGLASFSLALPLPFALAFSFPFGDAAFSAFWFFLLKLQQANKIPCDSS